MTLIRTPFTSPTPSPNVFDVVYGVALCDTLAGQLGWLGDKMGWKSVDNMTLMLMVICSLDSGLSVGSSTKGIIATLCFWLGFGIGRDYPISSTIMSEYANKKTHDAFIAAVFAKQGFDILTGGIIALIVSAGFFSFLILGESPSGVLSVPLLPHHSAPAAASL